ncbi:hypothetical protein WNY59_11070 [Ahrensia kielensis]|uniref:Uncharacterized protein n=1 Tax=Ahrensia kielensis TaxID=76980 RepID=A0ABU9T7N7_9HYPH
MIIDLNSKAPTAGIMFSGVEGVIYDISSEIIHGSYYSFDLFNKIQNGGTDHKDNIIAHYDSVYISICCSIAGFCSVINETICPADQIKALSELALDAVKPLALDLE